MENYFEDCEQLKKSIEIATGNELSSLKEKYIAIQSRISADSKIPGYDQRRLKDVYQTHLYY